MPNGFLSKTQAEVALDLVARYLEFAARKSAAGIGCRRLFRASTSGLTGLSWRRRRRRRNPPPASSPDPVFLEEVIISRKAHVTEKGARHRPGPILILSRPGRRSPANKPFTRVSGFGGAAIFFPSLLLQDPPASSI